MLKAHTFYINTLLRGKLNHCTIIKLEYIYFKMIGYPFLHCKKKRDNFLILHKFLMLQTWIHSAIIVTNQGALLDSEFFRK